MWVREVIDIRSVSSDLYQTENEFCFSLKFLLRELHRYL